jgi:hypothetical protein
MSVPALINVGEFFSDHYLATAFTGDLKQMRARWDREERAEKATPRQGMRRLSRAYYANRASAADAPDGDSAAAIREAVLEALGFHAREELWPTERGEGVPALIPTLHRTQTSTGTLLVALAVPFTEAIDTLLEPRDPAKPSQTGLLTPIEVNGVAIADPAAAVAMVFACDEAPRWVLLVAGSALLLADRATWGEGRYLIADIDGALSRGDTKELDTLASVFSADALVPDDGGQSALDDILDKSRKQAVGVSKDLREGIRRSVELLANEVVERLDQKQRVSNLALTSRNSPTMAGDLTRQSLRWLYRVLVLLFAEARPELGVLPTDHPEYEQGYGLGRLRDLVLRDLHGERARNGTHLHESIEVLCRLVHEGHNVTNVQQGFVLDESDAHAVGDVGLIVRPLDATLFGPDAIPLFDRVKLRNEVVHEVLGLLLLTKEKPGKPRQFVSYSTLGINQLGAVYEGLMAYTGFFAKEDLFEIAAPGNKKKSASAESGDGADQDLSDADSSSDEDEGDLEADESDDAADQDDPDDNALDTGLNTQTNATGRLLTAKTADNPTTASKADGGEATGEKGTWVIPVSLAEDYPPEVFIREPGLDGAPGARRRYAKGAFVFRLSGRDRQRSASYYTPEVLTRCVVKHSLAELLTDDTKASNILDLTICEPALGSGAFVNEAVSQLAAEYLKRAQVERGESLDPDQYLLELQRVKAHLAINNAYGVDLNPTAVELAEVSIWLNVMHPGLAAPWFGMRLRRGNSLIGARRATYATEMLKKAAWVTAPPADRSLLEHPLNVYLTNEIHHFLLPAHGWVAVADKKEAKDLRPNEVSALKNWRKGMLKDPGERATKRLGGLSRRTEALWQRAANTLQLLDAGLRQQLPLYGKDTTPAASTITREIALAELSSNSTALGRLRLVMNAWNALWFWPVDAASELPSWDGWLDALEGILGIVDQVPEFGQLSLFAGSGEDLNNELARVNDQLVFEFDMRAVDAVLADHPWLQRAQDIAEREGFWHWELEMAPVFAKGGFDLQVGNPPWVRPRWLDDAVLAELDPWFGVTEKPPVKVFRARRDQTLSDPAKAIEYLTEVASAAGLVSALGSSVEHSVLAGVQSNLYMLFMERTWRSLGSAGSVGLIHPESHFTDPKGGAFRSQSYRHLRRHFQFRNAFLLFEDVHDMQTYGIHVYGSSRDPNFLQIGSILNPAMADESITHDGSGPVPAIQYPWGGWDLRPHKERVVTVDLHVLASWAKLFDEPGTPPEQARLLRPVTCLDLEALDRLAQQPIRLADHPYQWTAGWHEKGAKEDGTIVWRTEVPASLDDIVIQGPHFTVGNPFAKQPNENCRHKTDWSSWDLETLPESVIPRTNYQRSCDGVLFRSRIDDWGGKPSATKFRLVWRAMAASGNERSLHSALVAPGPSNVGSCFALTLPNHTDLVLASGLWSSIPIDNLVKVSGAANVKEFLIKQFPQPTDSVVNGSLLLRTLRLNCLTAEYAPLWEELYDPSWQSDTWTDPNSTRPPLGNIGPKWTMDIPLRTDYDRRMALVEIDALAALMLGLTAEQLCAMYRTQFSVLRKYEYAMFFDAAGRKYAKHHQTAGVRQQKGDYESILAYLEDPTTPLRPGIAAPFSKPDREAEITHAYNTFQSRLKEVGNAAS